MPKCQWRDRPSDQPMCTTMASPGKSLCPRHEFMAELAVQRQLGKEMAKAESTGAPPRTRAELVKRGYHFKGQSHCRGCNLLIDWYDTPNGRSAPFNTMALDTSPAVSHFITCSRASSFKRSA